MTIRFGHFWRDRKTDAKTHVEPTPVNSLLSSGYAQSEFLTLASHQLRTPISAIAWQSELLLGGDSGTLTAEQEERVQAIYNSSLRLASIVQEMLVVSSIELGTFPVTPELVDLSHIAKRVLNEELTMAKDKKKLRIVEHYAPHLPQVPLDTQAAILILRSLISNAIKYTPDGGNISLEIVTTPEKLTPDSRGAIAIILSDSGYGIPLESQSQIFQKFFRAPNIVDKDTDGTGLGLYIVKALLEYVGGEISFDSAEVKGSTFVVRLPLEGMTERQVAAGKNETMRKDHDHLQNLISGHHAPPGS